MAGIYRRGGKTWWGRVQVAGREHRRSLRTTDAKEAKRRLDAWVKETQARGYFGLERHTWKEAVAKFFTDNPRKLKPSTAKRYLSSVAQVAGVLEELYLDQIDRRVIGKIASRPGASNATLRRDLDAVSSILRSCVRWGWLERNPTRDFDVDHIPEKRDPIVLPDEKEVEAFIAACHTVVDRSRDREGRGTLGYLAETLLLTGMRLEEAVQLEWSRVDPVRRAITLYRTKGNRTRTITLSPAAVAVLRKVPRAMMSPWVFWHSDGRPYANASSRLALIRTRLGIEWRAHDLRHLYAVNYLRAGGSVYLLKEQLGHESISTTERSYLAYLTPEERVAAKRLASGAGT